MPKRAPYKDTAARRARLLSVRNTDPTAATEAAKRSLRAGRGEGNVHARTWRIVSPTGDAYTATNLYEFVRAHCALFAAADVLWKRTGGKRGTGGEYCNATAGLLNVAHGRARAWKGWTCKHAE